MAVEARARDPIDEEVDRLLAEDPGLLAELQDFDRRYERGEVALVPHAEVRRRIGLGPDGPESRPEAPGGLSGW
ncbi:MAG TPA: hypothetical protein VMW49_09205 [Candidatus Dormibacteraeota bacterium]|nr:hypothetical protein [Candidatus Dormibacteraeota bacterium]